MKQFIPFILAFISFAAIAQQPSSISPNLPAWLSESPQITFPSGTIPGATSDELVNNSRTYLKINNTDLRNHQSGASRLLKSW